MKVYLKHIPTGNLQELTKDVDWDIESPGIIVVSSDTKILLQSGDFKLSVKWFEDSEVQAPPVNRSVGEWLEYNPQNKANIPCGKYLVCRLDGKIHFESFNGTGWAYNDEVIKYYSLINSPIENEK